MITYWSALCFLLFVTAVNADGERRIGGACVNALRGWFSQKAVSLDDEPDRNIATVDAGGNVNFHKPETSAALTFGFDQGIYTYAYAGKTELTVLRVYKKSNQVKSVLCTFAYPDGIYSKYLLKNLSCTINNARTKSIFRLYALEQNLPQMAETAAVPCKNLDHMISYRALETYTFIPLNRHVSLLKLLSDVKPFKNSETYAFLAASTFFALAVALWLCTAFALNNRFKSHVLDKCYKIVQQIKNGIARDMTQVGTARETEWSTGGGGGTYTCTAGTTAVTKGTRTGTTAPVTSF